MFNIFKKKQEEKRSYSANTSGSYFDDVNKDAMNIPAVFQAVTLISNTIAGVKDSNNPLGREPQENITKFNFMNTIVRNMLLEGNGYALIQGGGKFKLLDPKSVVPYYDKDYMSILYYQFQDKKVFPESMLHFRNISKDRLGQLGYSTLYNFANTFSRIQSSNDFEGTWTTNATRPSLWVGTERNLSEEAITKLKETLDNQYKGIKNTGKVLILPNGLQVNELNKSSNLVDADIAALKQASLKDIAQVFNIPVSLLDASISTYSNSVESNLSFLRLTIQPLLTNIKEEINMKLSTNLSHDTSSFLEGSFEQKIATLTSAVAGGILTPNECRERLNYPTIKDGDKLFSPAGTPTPGVTND